MCDGAGLFFCNFVSWFKFNYAQSALYFKLDSYVFLISSFCLVFSNLLSL
jgi:hypothetical protein